MSLDAPYLDTKSQVELVYEGKPTYCCAQCDVVITLQDETISKAFSGRDGRGFLVHSAVNIKYGKKEDRSLLTGVHTVQDIYCMGCNDRLGWHYMKAADASQKYKEGKFLLEREKLFKDNAWKVEAD